jgi:prophage regulatory protein
MTTSNTPPLSVLKLNDLCKTIGLGKSAIYDRLDVKSPRHDPTFPRPIKIGVGKNPPIRFISHEVDEWLNSQVRKSRGEV